MTERTKKESIAILGPGKVGTSVGHLLRQAGHEVVAVAARRLESAERAVAYTGGAATTDFAGAARAARCVLITTADDAIRSVCEAVAAGGGFDEGDRVVHTSGAGGLDLLEAARLRGAMPACIHPLQTFADVDSAIGKIPGSTFGVTADGHLLPWADGIVDDLGGISFHVRPEDKGLYHAAACMASNYFVTLMYLVEEIYGKMGLGRQEAMQAFWPLVRGTVANLEQKGTIASLTGPVARGDGGTVGKHMLSFRERFPALLDLYRDMGLFTADLAARKGTLTDNQLADIRSILKGGTER